MKKKLVKHGNSHAVILDKALLEVLTIDPETPLNISTDGKSIIITPMQNLNLPQISDNPKVQAAFEKVMKQFGPAFKELAKK